MLGNYVLDILNPDMTIVRAFRVYDDYGAGGAESETACLNYLGFVFKPKGFQLLIEFFL